MKHMMVAALILGWMTLGAKTFIREYTYNASEADSKISSRSIALEQVKRILLEEVGMYIQSSIIHQESESNGILSTLAQSDILVLSAGVTQTKILSEKWDGERYFLKAQIMLDENDVLAKLDALISDVRMHQSILDNRMVVDNALAQIDSLRTALAKEQDINHQLSLQQSFQVQTDKLRAIELLEEARTIDSTDENSSPNREKRIALLIKAVDADSTLGAAWLELGISCLLSDNLGMAKSALTKAWECTSDPYALLMLGDAHSNSKDFDTAFNFYEQSAQEYQSFIFPQYSSIDEDAELRLQRWRNSQRLAPLNRIAELHRQNGDINKALQAFLEILMLDPQNSTALIFATLIYTQLGRFDDALRMQWKLIEYDILPLDSGYEGIADIYVEKRDYPEAISYFRKAIQHAEDDRTSMYLEERIAYCYYKQGDYANAIPLYQKSFAKRPNDQYLPYMIGMCYEATEDMVNAGKFHQNAAKNGNDTSRNWCKERDIKW